LPDFFHWDYAGTKEDKKMEKKRGYLCAKGVGKRYGLDRANHRVKLEIIRMGGGGNSTLWGVIKGKHKNQKKHR